MSIEQVPPVEKINSPQNDQPPREPEKKVSIQQEEEKNDFEDRLQKLRESGGIYG